MSYLKLENDLEYNEYRELIKSLISFNSKTEYFNDVNFLELNDELILR